MLPKLLTSIFGSRNERLLKQYRRTVEQINALEAEGRLLARFDPMAHSPGRIDLRSAWSHPQGAATLDLRKMPF